MATCRVYAEVLTPDHFAAKAYAAGVKKTPPGQTLEELLRISGGRYEATTGISEGIRERLRKIAAWSSDKHLLHIASLTEIPVSLEHLRGVDPKTRIVVGCSISYTPEESARLGLRIEGPPDPKTTFIG